MQNKPLKKPCIIIGTVLLAGAAGLGSYSLMGMMHNPAFLAVNPGLVEHRETVGKPIAEALQNANIDPNGFWDGLLIGAIVVATAMSVVLYVLYERSAEENEMASKFYAVLSGMFACLATFGIGEIVACYTLPQLGDYTALTEHIAIAAGVIAAVGIMTMVVGSLANRGQEID